MGGGAGFTRRCPILLPERDHGSGSLISLTRCDGSLMTTEGPEAKGKAHPDVDRIHSRILSIPKNYLRH